MSKTKYKGVFYDEKHNSYYVNTTFKTKDGYSIKKCKRGFSTAKKANDWKLEFTVEAKNSTTINVKGDTERILIYYIEYKKGSLKPSTLIMRKDVLLTHFLPNVSSKIENINTQDLLRLYEHLSNLEISNKSKNAYIAIFNGFIEWLELTEQIDSKIVKKFKMIFTRFSTTSASKNSYITIEEYSKFIKTFSDEEDMFVLIFNILYFTGARFGEVLALEFNDVNFEENCIHFCKQALEYSNINFLPKGYKTINKFKIIAPNTKTNSVKTVTIPDWLTEDIKKWREKQNSQYLFSKNDVIITRDIIRRKFKKHLEMAELPIIKIHDLRHSHTTMLYDSGCDSKYVAERLGHSNELTSLNVYKHLTKARKQSNDDIIKSFKL
jgi:integrase